LNGVGVCVGVSVGVTDVVGVIDGVGVIVGVIDGVGVCDFYPQVSTPNSMDKNQATNSPTSQSLSYLPDPH
jgi:hypothetical protein